MPFFADKQGMETKVGIRKFRDRMRFNQADLAKRLEIKQASISKWEASKNYFPSFKVAAKLFELGITVEELFGIEYNKMHNLAKEPPPQAAGNEKMEERMRKLEERLLELESSKGKKEPPAVARTG